MKISEVTQKSHCEQLAEDRKQLDEVVPLAALGGAAWLASQGLTLADYYRLAKQQGTPGNPEYNPLNWDGEAMAELGIVAGSGVLGGLVGKFAGKAIGKSAGIIKGKLPSNSSDAIKTAKDQVKQAKQIRKTATSGPDKKAAKELVKSTQDDLKIAKANHSRKVRARGKLGSEKGAKVGKLVGTPVGSAAALKAGGVDLTDLIPGMDDEPKKSIGSKTDSSSSKTKKSNTSSGYRFGKLPD